MTQIATHIKYSFINWADSGLWIVSGHFGCVCITDYKESFLTLVGALSLFVFQKFQLMRECGQIAVQKGEDILSGVSLILMIHMQGLYEVQMLHVSFLVFDILPYNHYVTVF